METDVNQSCSTELVYVGHMTVPARSTEPIRLGRRSKRTTRRARAIDIQADYGKGHFNGEQTVYTYIYSARDGWYVYFDDRGESAR